MQEGNTYSLKKIIVFGIILLVIAGLIGFYFINKKSTTTTDTQNGKNLFPYGDNGGSNGTGSAVTTGGNVDTTGTPQPNDGTPISTTDADRLRQITQYPVTNIYSFVTQKTILEPKLDESTKETKLVARTTPVDMLRWNIKQTGILMDAEVSSDAIITTQKTETKIPDSQELWFGGNGNNIFFRTWNAGNRSITTLLGIIPQPPTLDYCNVTFTQDLKIGSKTSDVKELQKYINKKLLLNLAIDGSLGPKTFALIKQLQTATNTAETGVYDARTRDAINADCAKITDDFNKTILAPVKLTTSVLPSGIARGTTSPDGTQVFYLIPTPTGINGVIVSTNGSGGQRKVFESPLTEWSAQWVNKDTIALTTLASREANGYLYFVNATTGDFKKILGPTRGLTTLVSPDAKKVLYSNSTDQGFVTRIYNLDTGIAKNLDLATLPSKCTWQDTSIAFCGVPKTVPPGQYPDSWYQGLTSFNDLLWSIDATQGTTNIVLSPNQAFDMTHVTISPSGQYVYFINKIDETLWSYRLQ